MEFDLTWLQVDLDALTENMRAVRRRAGTDVLAVVKADAYGLGAVNVARALEDTCAFFGTANISEALELRRGGIEKPILILGRVPVYAYPLAVAEDIRVPIFIYEDAVALSEEAVRQGKTARFHFVVDTGMSRIGFQATEEALAMCQCILKLPNLQAEGLFSHYATADGADLTSAEAQLALFEDFSQKLRERGIEIPIRHLNNSAGIINFPGRQDMVRSGIVQYGMYPSDAVDPTLLPVKPVMEWIAKVVYVKTLPAGRQISYGGCYTTTQETVIATLPVGYADGYRRGLTDKGYVLIHGKKAPIIGRICMDQMMVDVTHIPEVKIGDRAVLIGKSGDEQITADDLARLTGTLNYEIICGISRRTPRVYLRGGKPVSEVHYLLDTQKK
ncbi:MAG: alanine racemase [Oscillospiraceae bacterium]|nr:alanine racemase [Oscillospiraceae bacterium]